MRHYFSYNAEGELIAAHLWFGGFPEEAKIEDEDPASHPVVHSLINEPNANLPGRVGYVLSECPCPSSKGHCGCARRIKDSGRVVDGALVINPKAEVWVDGVKVDSATAKPETPMVLPPLTTHTVKFKVPDGSADGFAATLMSITNAGFAIMSLALPKPMMVTAGETEELSFVVPSQGMKGGLYLQGPRVAPTRLYVMGFATS